jgi:hypothetical protein
VNRAGSKSEINLTPSLCWTTKEPFLASGPRDSFLQAQVAGVSAEFWRLPFFLMGSAVPFRDFIHGLSAVKFSGYLDVWL